MDYQKVTEYRNRRSAFAQRMGIVVEEIREGYARAVKTVTAEDTNPLGRAHGAVLFAVADIACGSAAAAYGRKAVTLNASYNFLRGCSVGDRVTAEAREVKHGATISVYDAVVTDQNGKPVGSATMTFYTLDEPLDL
jgi:acyl-CoA thioesterase